MDGEQKDRLVDQTLNIWQSRTSRKLSREDAREIAENTTGFFQILRRWAREVSANGIVDNSAATKVNQQVGPQQGSEPGGNGGKSQ